MLTLAEVEHIATLARLELTPEEKRALPPAALGHPGICRQPAGPGYQRHFPHLQRAAASRRAAPGRDCPQPAPTDLLRNAPQSGEDGTFRVPPVLDQSP